MTCSMGVTRVRWMLAAAALLALVGGVILATQPVGAQGPDAPTNVTATGGAGQATLSWTPPPGTITKYQYKTRKGVAQWSGWKDIPDSASKTSYVITGLQPGLWRFILRAVSAAGGGAATVPPLPRATVTSPPATPGAPMNLTATGGAGQATLSWTPPPGTITKYRYTTRKGTAKWAKWTDLSAPRTSYTITGLSAGSYLFRLRAVNAAGNGAHVKTSSAVTVTTPPSAPSAPSSLQAAGSAGQIALSWGGARWGAGEVWVPDEEGE